MAKYCEDILGDLLLKRPLELIPVSGNIRLVNGYSIPYFVLIVFKTKHKK